MPLLVPNGSLVLLPTDSTDSEQICLLHFELYQREAHPVAFRVVLEGSSPFQTITMGSFPDVHVK